MSTFADRILAILNQQREEALAGFPFPIPLSLELVKTIASTEPEATFAIWRERLGHDRFRLHHSAAAGAGWCLWFADELDASQAALTGLDLL